MDFLTSFRDGSLLPDAVAASGLRAAWDNFVWFVDANPQFSLWLAILLLLLILLLLVRSRRARRDVRVYQESGGFAVVSQKALRRLIHIACEDAGLAGGPKIHFWQSRGVVNVEVGLKLYQSQRLSEVHELLRHRIRVAVEDTHGIRVGDVNIKVLGFRKDARRDEEVAAFGADPLAEEAFSGAPAEASAASLYEEPATEEGSLTSGSFSGTSLHEADDAADSVSGAEEGAPKKRRFSFFGRKKESAPQEGDSLFVSGEQDATADPDFAVGSVADSEPVADTADEQPAVQPERSADNDNRA